VKQLGIAIKFSAAYAPQQNGSAERSGGVLVAKARAIRIESSLPEQLWPEAMRAAGYLANRSLTRSLGWASPIKVPFKAVNLPHPRLYLGHLRVYGRRAYAHIPGAKRLRKEKLLEHALLGYLVGYDSTNIFRI
jgi:transposase InsO family protein